MENGQNLPGEVHFCRSPALCPRPNVAHRHQRPKAYGRGYVLAPGRSYPEDLRGEDFRRRRVSLEAGATTRLSDTPFP